MHVTWTLSSPHIKRHQEETSTSGCHNNTANYIETAAELLKLALANFFSVSYTLYRVLRLATHFIITATMNSVCWVFNFKSVQVTRIWLLRYAHKFFYCFSLLFLSLTPTQVIKSLPVKTCACIIMLYCTLIQLELQPDAIRLWLHAQCHDDDEQKLRGRLKNDNHFYYNSREKTGQNVCCF